MWFTSLPANLNYITTAHHHIQITITSKSSAERLYQILLDGENQKVWAKGYKKTIWFNEIPTQFGSIRDIHLAWIKVRERMLALEPSKRFAFSSDALSIPLINKMVEDIFFNKISDDETLITWNVYYDLRSFLKPFSRFLEEKFFKQMFYDFAKGLSDYAESNPTKIIK
jgi:hypothetical protein